MAHYMRKYGFFPLYPPAKGRRQPVHVDDLAQSAMKLLDVPASYSKSYNLSGGETLILQEMVVRLFTLCRPKVRIINLRYLPFMLDAASRLFQKKALSGEIARRMNEDVVFFHDEPQQDFGYAPRTFLSGGPKDLGGF